MLLVLLLSRLSTSLVSSYHRAITLKGQINPSLPVTSGDAHVHISNFTSIIHGDMPCHFMNPRQMTEVEDKIGSLIADNLIDDGATLQTG